MKLLDAKTDCIDKVSLSTTRRSIHEEWIESLGRMSGNGFAYTTSQTVAFSFKIVVETVIGEKLRIEVLHLWSCNIAWCGACIHARSSVHHLRSDVCLFYHFATSLCLDN